jgi:hypothetical protein
MVKLLGKSSPSGWRKLTTAWFNQEGRVGRLKRSRHLRTPGSRAELILCLAHHEAGHTVAGVALGFSLDRVEIYRPEVFLRGHAFFSRPPLAEQNPWYAVVGAAGPAAERRWLASQGLTMEGVYADGCRGDESDWRRVSETAQASGCATRVLCGVARAMMEDARVWPAVSGLANALAERLGDGKSFSMPGDEALAIMGVHGVTPAMGVVGGVQIFERSGTHAVVAGRKERNRAEHGFATCQPINLPGPGFALRQVAIEGARAGP